MNQLKKDDPAVYELTLKEGIRIENTIDLVASETHMSQSTLETMGSVVNHKTIICH
jgi:glycine/serine hydroxymethyltransferase